MQKAIAAKDRHAKEYRNFQTVTDIIVQYIVRFYVLFRGCDAYKQACS